MDARLAALLPLLLLPWPAGAQESPPRGQGARPSPDRQVTIVPGIGNDMGWFGVQGEWYFAGDRLSAFSGLGWTPEIDAGDPTGPTFASGLRAFTSGRNHRGFAELSVSQVAVSSLRGFGPGGERIVDGERHYGPGLQAGYQYVADGGFTVLASFGVGFILDDGVSGESDAQPLLGLGIGYTWR